MLFSRELTFFFSQNEWQEDNRKKIWKSEVNQSTATMLTIAKRITDTVHDKEPYVEINDKRSVVFVV